MKLKHDKLLVLAVFWSSAAAMCIYGTAQENPGKSCKEILLKNPDCYRQSDYYWVNCNGTAIQVYCEMTRLGGGWMRLGQFNFTNGTGCPGDWFDYEGNNGLHYCTVTDTGTGSERARASWRISPECPYSEINGYVLADQKGLCDAFFIASSEYDDQFSLTNPYVDGVTFSYDSPNTHLFTYAVGREETARTESCQCHGSTTPPPLFVMWDYTCDSGVKPFSAHVDQIGERILWTGRDCDPLSHCCHRAGAPWFYKSLPNTQQNIVHVRIMFDDGWEDEMVLVREIGLYVR